MGKVGILLFKYNEVNKLRKSKIIFPLIYLIFLSCFFLKSNGQEKYSIKDLSHLITTNSCNKCNLEGIDLVNKDFSNAQITNSNLKNANLSGGYLDNINFYGTDLSGSSFKNTSLRNANFQKSTLNDTDFQYADFTNATFDFEGLSKSSWGYSLGVKKEHDNFENFYNKAVKYYLKKDYIYSIKLFSLAIDKNPLSIESFLSRAIINFNLGRDVQCLEDLKRSNELMINSGNTEYQNTVRNLNEIIYERNKNINNRSARVLRTVVQSLALFQFL